MRGELDGVFSIFCVGVYGVGFAAFVCRAFVADSLDVWFLAILDSFAMEWYR